MSIRERLGYLRRVDTNEAMAALQSVDIASTRVTPILGGWAYWTFDVDAHHIARFPRNDEIAAAAHRELALLPALAEEVSFMVPDPSHKGIWVDRPFMVYPRIPGRALTRSHRSPELLGRLKDMLAELHQFSPERASQLLGTGPPREAWQKHFEELWPVIEMLALPTMDEQLADRVRREFGWFLESPFDVPRCLIHNDLGPEHILIDPTTGLPTGLIDFESAWVGDPAIDFVPLRAHLSPQDFDAVLGGRDLGDGLAERMRFYRWMGSVHAIIHGVSEDRKDELAAGVEELRRRLDIPA